MAKKVDAVEAIREWYMTTKFDDIRDAPGVALQKVYVLLTEIGDLRRANKRLRRQLWELKAQRPGKQQLLKGVEDVLAKAFREAE